jgi:hypothetical protein
MRVGWKFQSFKVPVGKGSTHWRPSTGHARRLPVRPCVRGRPSAAGPLQTGGSSSQTGGTQREFGARCFHSHCNPGQNGGGLLAREAARRRRGGGGVQGPGIHGILSCEAPQIVNSLRQYDDSSNKAINPLLSIPVTLTTSGNEIRCYTPLWQRNQQIQYYTSHLLLPATGTAGRAL